MEYQILIDVEPDTPEDVMNKFVEEISEYIKENKLETWFSDVYWDEV